MALLGLTESQSGISQPEVLKIVFVGRVDVAPTFDIVADGTFD